VTRVKVDERGSGEASNGKSDSFDNFATVTIVKPADQTITLSPSRYDELVSKLAAAENRLEHLLEYKAESEASEEKMLSIEPKLATIKGRNEVLQRELADRMKSFWKRLFVAGKRTWCSRTRSGEQPVTPAGSPG
jgi:hypothetical protein